MSGWKVRYKSNAVKGFVRGKSDKIEPQRIARYAHLSQNNTQLIQISLLTLEKLKDIQANRRRLMKALQSLHTSVVELKQFDTTTGKVIEKVNREAIRGLEKSLDKVDDQILTCISDDQALKQKYDLMLTVKGVGKC